MRSTVSRTAAEDATPCAGRRNCRKSCAIRPWPSTTRYLMYTLRVLACRAELDLARQLAPHISEPETAREIIRQTLFASETSLVPDHQAGILRVRLLHQSRNCIDEALQPLLAELNKTKPVYPGHQPGAWSTTS